VAAYCASFSSYFIDFVIGDVAMSIKLLFNAHLFDVPQFLLYCRLEGQELTVWRWLLRRERRSIWRMEWRLEAAGVPVGVEFDWSQSHAYSVRRFVMGIGFLQIALLSS